MHKVVRVMHGKNYILSTNKSQATIIDHVALVRRSRINVEPMRVEIEDHCVQRGVAIDRLNHVLPIPQPPCPSALITQDLQCLRK